MMRKLLERIAIFTQKIEPQKKQEQKKSRKKTHSKPRVHNPVQTEVMTLEQRIGSLEKALEAHMIEIAQMKGEYAAEMRHAKGKEARDELTEAYYSLKEEAAAYAEGIKAQLKELRKQAKTA